MNSLVKDDALAATQIRDEVGHIITNYPADVDKSCRDEFMQFLDFLVDVKTADSP